VETDFGQPLTEALPVVAQSQGVTHHLRVQVFARTALAEDDDHDADDQPPVHPLDLGVDYLHTLGPPTVVATIGESVWSIASLTPLSAPRTGTIVMHAGLHFPFTLTGARQWTQGTLWYGVNWHIHQVRGTGWAPAQALTFASPDGAAGWAAFDALSPALAHYLASLGNNIGVAVYDLTNNQYYTYNSSGRFITASSIKVPIMLTLLAMTEAQDREPDSNEMALLTAMIENSDNDAASALYTEIGDDWGINQFMNQIGVTGLDPNADAFGWSSISPLTMVRLLTLLQEGKILTAQDRALALNLMENIEPDQRMGVGDTAPHGAIYAMKDGWVPGPDNLWWDNSSGIVTVGPETYIISVYTGEQDSEDDGWSIVDHVCAAIGQILAA